MSQRSDTKRWLAAHLSDPYVKAAHADNYRTRAVYKLAEIDNAHGLLANARCVLDLGAAPGGWSQYLRRNAPKAHVIALERLPMEPVEGVIFLQADFAEQDGLDLLLSELGTTT